MSHARISSCILSGARPVRIDVEIHVGTGLPSIQLVGLADTEVREARERVRCALLTCGLPFPHDRRVTISLAPADLPKDSGRFDLPIALALLVAGGVLDAASLRHHLFAGELALDGELRPIRAALPMVLACASAGWPDHWVLPGISAREACLVPGIRVHQALHLHDIVDHFRGQPAPGWASLETRAPVHSGTPGPDLADVRGHQGVKRALEIAAAGGHNILLVGPPGSGKSMLAQRLPALLPPPELQHALESAALLSLAGHDILEHWGRRPYRAPHHSATAPALIGGGSPPRPGEISLAHHGVLFLDELPEFRRQALESLREPLENQRITLSRAAHQIDYPADFQLIAAMNPCPCGHLGSPHSRCRCTPDQIIRYQGRLSGPLLDRIDLHIEVPLIPAPELMQASGGEPSAQVRQRCAHARERAQRRQGLPNARLPATRLSDLPMTDIAQDCLHTAAQRWQLSARAIHRCWRVALTIADLAHTDTIDLPHITEALQYRHRAHDTAGTIGAT